MTIWKWQYDDGSISTHGRSYWRDEAKAREKVLKVLRARHDSPIDESALTVEKG